MAPQPGASTAKALFMGTYFTPFPRKYAGIAGLMYEALRLEHPQPVGEESLHAAQAKFRVLFARPAYFST